LGEFRHLANNNNNNNNNNLPKFQGKLPLFFLFSFWGEIFSPFHKGSLWPTTTVWTGFLALAPPLNTLVLIGMLTI
jgi:hypothetical protein